MLETLGSHTEGPDCSGWDIYTTDSNVILKQAPTWFPENGKRKCGRPIKSQSDILSEHLQNIDVTRDDFGQVTDD